jgi:hypothetical protein
MLCLLVSGGRRMSHWFRVVLVVVVTAVVGCAAPAFAQTVHRSPDHWSITIPEGWELDTGERLAWFNQAANDRAASMPSAPKVTYVALLVPKNPDGRYVLLQTQPSLPSGARLSDLRRVIDETTRRVQNEINQSTTLDTTLAPTLDRERARVITVGRVAMPGEDASGLLSITNFGAAGNILVHAYAPEVTFVAARPALQAIADSFAFDPGHAYQFRSDGMDWKQPLIMAAAFGIFGGVIGAIMQKRKPKAL